MFILYSPGFYLYFMLLFVISSFGRPPFASSADYFNFPNMIHVADNCTPKKIGIVNYSTGNTASVGYFLDRLGLDHQLVSTPDDLIHCDAAILPGVGHYHTAYQSLMSSGLFAEIKRLSGVGFPVIGICLGFQLMTLGSEESPFDPGLNIFPFSTVEIKPQLPNFKVPHIGWNSLDVTTSDTPLFHQIIPGVSRFFFANRFGVKLNTSSNVSQALYTHSGQWIAIAHSGNALGLQFHPEKSRSNGYTIVNNFFNLVFNRNLL